jgi:hypothetical protein
MFEDIFDVKRGRNLLDMFLSPTEDDGIQKDIARLIEKKINFVNFQLNFLG